MAVVIGGFLVFALAYGIWAWNENRKCEHCKMFKLKPGTLIFE